MLNGIRLYLESVAIFERPRTALSSGFSQVFTLIFVNLCKQLVKIFDFLIRRL